VHPAEFNALKRGWAIPGTIVFFILAPGTVAVLVPYALTRWRVQGAAPGGAIGAVVGTVLILGGVASLVESFARFALKGLGTPAPVAPPTQLVVSGQYRYVRNPMYVAILAIVLGQSLVLGSVRLLAYAALVWVVVHVWVLAYEEPTLTRTFGPSYREYRQRVRRWWPRLTP
jgi:protein-S-isoprenylcysteine O-methyltransferase Ste14